MREGSNLIKVEFTYLPVINFAFQQNRVSVIRVFTIENISGNPLRNVCVELSTEPDFAEAVPYLVEEIPANHTIRIDELKLKLSTNFFIQLTERLAGNISLTIKVEEEIVFKEDYPIDVLAFDQWSGISILPEMLSAFVTPNHPALIPIQRRAATILEQMTGNPALDEYQSRNPNRVKNQMAAIYNAIAEQEIIYSSVPASFEKYGQRIRMVDSVTSQKLGTCLDMALLYASCLEAIGIHPLVVVTQGHAFAGAWLVADTFPDSVIDDVSFLTKRTAEGINEIILLETTCMNKGNDATFDRAVQRAHDSIRQMSDFVLALDVKRSRYSGVRPLPLRVLNGDHWQIKESEDRFPEKEIVNPEAINPYDLSNLSDNVEVTKQLMWERKLLDLSLRNNLLNIRITRNTLQLISADLDKFENALTDGSEFRLMGKPTDWDNPLYDFGVYRALSSSNPIVELVKSEMEQKRLRTYLAEVDLDKSLKHLYRSSRLSIEENGANTLYLALGLLRWYETPTSERPRYAPILLFPVEMIRKSAAKGYIIRSREEDIMLNITLLEMLRQNFGINVPGLESLPKDKSGVNIRLIYSIFRNSLKNLPKWDVEEQAILGIFSFNKFIMWNDIHNNSDKLMQNKLVQSLVNGKIEFEVDDTLTDAADLDKKLSPADIVLPISADSSQLEAVYEAINDKTYILHGPPGTGKSQTITNIIANALYRKKRVLFVAEKMAALSVVQNRLESIGLAPFCLELHSNKAKKTDVLSQLKTTTEIVKQRSPENFNRDAKRLFELRKNLNVYVEALHKLYPFGLSLYQAITNYLALETDYEIQFPSQQLSGLTEDKLLEWQDNIDLLVSVGNACGHPYNHPLSGISLLRYTPEAKEKSFVVLKKAIKVLSDLKKQTAVLDTITGNTAGTKYSREQFDMAKTLFSVLLQIPGLTSDLLHEQKTGEMFAECKEVTDHGKERDRYKKEIRQHFNEGILAIDAKSLLREWNVAANKWYIPRYFGQKKVRGQLKLYIDGGTMKHVDIKSALTNIIQYHYEQKLVNDYSPKLQSLFGKFAGPENEQWEVILQIIDDFTLFDNAVLTFTKDIVKANELKENIAGQLVSGIDTFRKVHGKSFNEFKGLMLELEDVFSEISRVLNVEDIVPVGDDTLWLDCALSRFNSWVSHIDKLKDWCQWLTAKEKAVALQIGFVADEYRLKNIPTDQLKNSFLKGFCHAAIDHILAQESGLELFKGELFNDVISKYKELNDNFAEITRKELYAVLAANIPSFTTEATHNSEVGILQRSIRSNARGMSIRNLFDQIPTLLSRLCPCMLMSPISVAQYINPDADKFDMIIFDEASQMPTYEAVGAIARGKNMIIVGDPKQMPPTNFFSANNVDEDNLDKEDLESILDDSLALSIPSRYLLWHYRSKHESLIAFSNSEYYDNKLLTFPSPDNIESKVSLVHIDGFYDKGRSRQNKSEAEAVVKEIERRLLDEELRKKSIGVVTFSAVQQNLIEDLLSDLFIFKPELEAIAMECKEPLFIKNLENVQGDERDVILFSVGYGPDAEGRVSMNFGPLNRNGGERRLNVAVSRARYEMIIFSTLRSDRIDLNRTSSMGVKSLKRFLEFAEKGAQLNRERQLIATKNSSIENLVAERLRATGYEVHTNIGTSGYKIDIAVVDEKNPGNYILGIICDGENYRRTKTIRDREIVQNSVLHMLGWNICRVWTLDWWENPSMVLKRIEAAIDNAKKGIPAPVVAKRAEKKERSVPGGDGLIKQRFVHNRLISGKSSPIEEKPIVMPEESKKTEDFGGKEDTYVYANLPKTPFPPESFLFPEHENYIIRQIQMVLDVEAPISRSLLCKRVLGAWGITRLGSRIDSYFNELFTKVEHYLKKEEESIFFWRSEEQMASYETFRPLSERTALDLTSSEVSNAVKYLLASQISLPTKDLIRLTAQLFGFSRTGSIVDHVMYQGMQEAVRRGYIKVDNGRAVIL